MENFSWLELILTSVIVTLNVTLGLFALPRLRYWAFFSITTREMMGNDLGESSVRFRDRVILHLLFPFNALACNFCDYEIYEIEIVKFKSYSDLEAELTFKNKLILAIFGFPLFLFNNTVTRVLLLSHKLVWNIWRYVRLRCLQPIDSKLTKAKLRDEHPSGMLISPTGDLVTNSFEPFIESRNTQLARKAIRRRGERNVKAKVTGPPPFSKVDAIIEAYNNED